MSLLLLCNQQISQCLFYAHICATCARWPCHDCNSSISSKGLQCCLEEVVAMHSSRVTYRCSRLVWGTGCLHGLSVQAETQRQQLSQWQQRSLLAMPCTYTTHSIESFSTCLLIEPCIHSSMHSSKACHIFRRIMYTTTVCPDLVKRLQRSSNMQHTCGICQAAET